MDEAFIFVSVISGVFGIVGLLILDRNWFRRENFKMQANFTKQEYSLRMKKMAKDLGLASSSQKSSSNIESSSPLQTIGSLAPLLKSLAPEQISDLVGVLTGKPAPEGASDEEGPESPLGGIDGLLEFATKNPQLVQGFLDGLSKKGEGGQDLI